MKIEFFNNKSKSTKLNKEIDKKGEINCTVKHDCSLMDPVVIIESENYLNCNYCYIENFGRYYYITDIVRLVGKRYQYKLHVDVLMSFKNDINNCVAFIERSESAGNEYMQDPLFPILTKREIKIQKEGFNQFDDTLSNYLVVTGGGVQ